MKWYNYVACFFAGIFLTNAVPHYIQGISGECFPTPFANPPGVGLSSPLLNVLWALLNLVIGYFLFKAGKVSNKKWTILIFFIGIAIMSIHLSITFAKKM
jgi:hypothetical protein